MKTLSVNDRYVVFSLILVLFLFLSVTQTLNSGFHFVDDHEIIRIKHDLGKASLSDVTREWIKEDINSTARFRPLYFAFRVFLTAVFGSDFFFWSLFNGLIWCVTFVFFYLGIRNLRYNIYESVLFLVIAFIGPQSEVWWRLGPQESLGVVFLSLAFFFMSLSNSRRILNNLLFSFFLILSSLCKESFILVIPAFIFLKISNEKNILRSDLRYVIRNNLILLIPLFAAAVEIVFIKYRVGTAYSGLSGESGSVMLNLWYSCTGLIKTYLNLIIAGIILIIYGYTIRKRIFWFDISGFVFFILILIPVLLLYARTGLVDRYLLPGTIGLAFFIVSCLKDIADNSLVYRKITYALLLVSFVPHMIGVVNDASGFATEGKETNRLLEAIESGYVKDNQVLVIADPVTSYEASVSLKIFLNLENGIDLYGYPVITDRPEMQGYLNGWKSYFNGRLYENMTAEPGMLIFLDSRLTDEFFRDSSLEVTDYEPLESGSYTYSLLRRKSY